MTPQRIIGAGLAGLLAAHAWPNTPVIEAASEPRAEHKALLRFRSDAVARLTGIDFRKVTVRKGIWHRGEYRSPTIALANAYSRKVTGALLPDRSIWNLDAAERFVAPNDFYERLVDHVGSRIQWATSDDFRNGPVISTAPLPIVLGSFGMLPVEFKRAAIEVLRFRIPHCDLFQTVYFPDPRISLYRASITADLLIVERMAAPDSTPFSALESDAIRLAFDVAPEYEVDRTTQQYGKIIPLDDTVRKSILFGLTHDHNVYSLGRFATWRNVLLDDIVDDIGVIKRLLKTGDKFDVARARAL